MKSISFNLIEENWIQVLWADGAHGRAVPRATRKATMALEGLRGGYTPDHVGIRRALTEAGRIRQIAASNPMDNVALLHFLLRVHYTSACTGWIPSLEL